jgi:hypothetical protein
VGGECAFALALTASFAVLAAVIAFAIVGYLGLAILGILTLLICATMEIGKDGPLGSINTPDLHAWDAQPASTFASSDEARRSRPQSAAAYRAREPGSARLAGVSLA